MENKKIIPGLNDGITLTLIPIIGLVVAYVFEVGYLSFYDAPRDLIKLDINQIFASTTITSLFIISLVILIIHLSHHLSNPSYFIRVISSSILLCFPLFLFTILIPHKYTNEYLIYIIFMIAIIFSFFDQRKKNQESR